jgi:glutaminyl-peptide cyclotransferase
MILDDHVPFMDRGVEVLHIIPSPFPRVWHKLDDDGEHLDIETVEDWTTLVTAFVAEWMELEGFMPTSAALGKRDGRGNTARTGSKSEL